MTTSKIKEIDQKGLMDNQQQIKLMEMELANIEIKLGEEYQDDYKSNHILNPNIIDLKSRQSKQIKDLKEARNALLNTKVVEINTALNIVKMGDIVQISELFVGDLEKEINTYKLTCKHYADIFAEVPEINTESPLGQAIIGQKVGAVINYEVSASKTKVQVEILAINPEINKIK